jgi:hypothetical protein
LILEIYERVRIEEEAEGDMRYAHKILRVCTSTLLRMEVSEKRMINRFVNAERTSQKRVILPSDAVRTRTNYLYCK